MAADKPPGFDEFLKAGAAPTSVVMKPAGFDEFIAPELRTAKYGTPTEILKTGAEGAAAAATFGVSTGAEVALGVDPEDIRGRREENPIAYGVGQAAGIIAPSLLVPGSGLAFAGRGLTAAGQAGVKLAGITGQTGVSRIGAAAVKNAIEGALFQSGDEISKMLSKDPNQSVETAVVNVGLSSLIGGGVGGVMGGGAELWRATIGRKLGSSLDSASSAINSDVDNVVPQGVQAAPQPSVPTGAQEDALAGAVATPKTNIQDIQAAASRVGVEPTPGMLSGDKFAQDVESNLIRRPTVMGHKMNKETQAVYDGINKAGEKTLATQTLKTEAQVGREIKEGMADVLEKELKPIEAAYKKLQPKLKEIELTDDLKLQAITPVVDHELARIAPKSTAAKLARSLSEEIIDLKNVNDVKVYRTLINKRLEAAYRAGGEEIPILQQVKNSLTDLRENAIKAAAEHSNVPSRIPKKEIANLRATDAAYAAYKTKLKQMGVEAGLGSLNDARSMLQKFSKLSDESFAKRVFDTNDINQLAYFKQNFPAQYDLGRRYKLREISEHSFSQAQGKNGQFEVGKFLAQVRKIGPEARAELFQGHSQALKDIDVIYKAMPGNVNPSGTAAALAHGSLFSIQGLVDNAADAGKYALLRAMPYMREAAGHVGSGQAGELAALRFAAATEKGVDPTAFQQMARFIGETIKGESALSKATKAVIDGGEVVLPSKLIPDDKSREKLNQKLKDLQSNNTPLLNVSDKLAHYMPDHGTAVAATSANAVNYLNSLRPSEDKKSPLDSKPVVSKADTAAFNRALDIAEQPLLVLGAIPKGILTPSDLKHLHTLYPALYGRMREKLTANLINHMSKDGEIPYKTRIGLSLFMAQPLDSTMTPIAISSAQPIVRAPLESQPQTMGTSKMSKLGKVAKSEMTPLQARQADVTSKV